MNNDYSFFENKLERAKKKYDPEQEVWIHLPRILEI